MSRWSRVIIIFVSAVFSFYLMLSFDTALLRWRYHLIGSTPQGYVQQILGSFREFGQAMVVIVTIVIVATFDRRRTTIISCLLVAELFAALGYDPGKWLIGRYRPYAAIDIFAAEQQDPLKTLNTFSYRDTWIGWKPGNWDLDTQSFPSGHSAAAFTLATILAAFYPRLGWFWYTLATGCACSRYLDTVHWPSDCWAGTILGYLSARLALAIMGSKAGPRRQETTP